jgi:hypothetical protein
MPQDHVRHFVSHHTRQLCLVAHCSQQACVDEHRSSGQSESVDGRIRHNLKREGEAALPGFTGTAQSLPDAGDIFVEVRVVDYDHLLANSGSVLLAELDLLLLREQVEIRMELSRALRPGGNEQKADRNERP